MNSRFSCHSAFAWRGRWLAFLVVLGGLLAMPATAVEAPPPAVLPGEQVQVPVPDNMTLAELDHVLGYVAMKRQWSIDVREPGHMELSLDHQQFIARFIITYDTSQVTVRSDSRRLDGRREVPARWMRHFVTDLIYQFNAKRR